MIIIPALAVALIVALFVWALCVAAARADRNTADVAGRDREGQP